ncbi:ImmA/IrrE family metallo-endopeptidase [Enterococcus sp. AZ192]|uniref:ImmA/IrrE family metallo-endopeptidase n=1 Tax=unclassified Enterococcus TaxID=2608891 RepID=UPI003D282657
MQISKMMDDLKNKYGTMNPFNLSEHMNIEIKYVNFLKNPRGQYTTILGDKVILLSNSIKDTNEEYFVCAHELGHALLHTDISGYYSLNNSTKNKSEYEASKFATKLIYELYKEEHDFKLSKIDLLSKEYGLPETFYSILENN